MSSIELTIGVIAELLNIPEEVELQPLIKPTPEATISFVSRVLPSNIQLSPLGFEVVTDWLQLFLRKN